MTWLFIPDSDLGVALGGSLRDMYSEQNTKKRKTLCGRFVSVLRNLRLIDPHRTVYFVANGMRVDGTPGLLVVYHGGDEATVSNELPLSVTERSSVHITPSLDPQGADR